MVCFEHKDIQGIAMCYAFLQRDKGQQYLILYIPPTPDETSSVEYTKKLAVL